MNDLIAEDLQQLPQQVLDAIDFYVWGLKFGMTKREIQQTDYWRNLERPHKKQALFWLKELNYQVEVSYGQPRKRRIH